MSEGGPERDLEALLQAARELAGGAGTSGDELTRLLGLMLASGDATHVWLVALEEERPRLLLRGTSGLVCRVDPREAWDPREIGWSLARGVLRAGRALGHVGLGPSWLPSEQESGESPAGRAVLCLPLTFRGVIRGAVYAENRERMDAFAPQRCDWLQGLATLMAIVIAADHDALSATAERVGAPLSDDAGLPHRQSDSDSALLGRLEAVARAHLHDPSFGVAQWARRGAMSERSLLRAVQHLTHRSPVVWLREIRLQEAHRMLCHLQHGSVAEVAAAVGMSRSHLVRTYSAWAGVAPSEVFRRSRLPRSMPRPTTLRRS